MKNAHNHTSRSNGEGTPQRIGFLSTWNQACGLATNAKFLVDELIRAGLNVTVLAERGVSQSQPDESFVSRCWSRVQGDTPHDDYAMLEREIERLELSILHINCQARFFSFPAFQLLLRRLRGRGIKVIVHLHNLFTVSEELSALITTCDRLFVHTPENRLEAIANGARPEAVSVIPLGVCKQAPVSEEKRREIRATLGVEGEEALLITFGFIQPHKGIEALVEAVTYLQQRGIPARGVIIGETRTDDPQSATYLRGLRDLVNRSGVTNRISFISTFIPEEQVGTFLSAADLVVMNYRSQHFEASAACSQAVGAGAVVLTSLAPAMMAFGDAVWHITSGYPVGLSAELLLRNHVLREDIKARAQAFTERHSWGQIAQQVGREYEEVSLSQSRGTEDVHELQTAPESTVTKACQQGEGRKFRVLMQNRPNTFSQRGGDTVLVERLSQGLAVRGYEVRVDVEGSQNPAEYDLVHLFNFATPKLTQALAERARAAGVPFVVTSLYEDVPEFHYQSHAVANALIEYVKGGQRREWWNAHRVDPSMVRRADRFQADWIARHAAAVIVNGPGEARAVKRDFVDARTVMTVRVGHETGRTGDACLFERTYGVKDFVLCVGRLETRKNQLMLLKALEDSDVTVVLAAGGFSYQPEYDHAVRTFKRRGKTLILDRLTPDMLASAYAACRIHALPSWYELPGLVSLEAAAHGKNIVATPTGTSRDYLGDIAFYCDPGSEDSIRSAIMSAFEAPPRQGLVQMAQAYTWERALDETLGVYESVLQSASDEVEMRDDESKVVRPVSSVGCYDMSLNAGEFEDLLEQGEAAAKQIDFTTAEELLRRADSIDGQNPRVLRALGAVMLAQSKVVEAQTYFDRAMALAPSDPKTLTGRGMCEALSGRPADAVEWLQRALAISPDNLVALYQLIDCAYRLDQYGEVLASLRTYLAGSPNDIEMRFCLAGCLFKVEEFAACRAEVEVVLQAKPEHEGGLELKARIAEKMRAAPAVVIPEVVAQTTLPAQPQDTVFSPDILDELSERISQWTVIESTSAGNAYGSDTSQRMRELPPASVSTGLDEHIQRIEVLKRTGKLTQAKELLDEVLTVKEMNPAQRETVTCLDAEFKVIMGELGAAAALYNKLLDKNPHLARALCGKGALAAEEQDWVTAQAFFETSLDYDPQYDVAIAGVGLCKMVSNKTEEAFNLFRRAATVNPENYRAVLGVLQLGYPLKRFAEMESLVLAYLKRYPSNLDMLYSFAGLLYAQGRMEEARSQVEKILVAEPSHESALELRDIIQKTAESPPIVM